MPITAFLHTHVLVVVLFLILFIIKAALLFLDKRESLAKVRKKTRVFDMIFGTLILVTGGYMLFQYHGVPTWLIIKVVLVLLAIPLGIIGIKRENKVLTALSLLAFLYVYGVSETKSLSMSRSGTEAKVIAESPETDATETGTPSAAQTAQPDDEILSSMNENALANAQAIYVQICAACHGEDGKKQLAGAPDLTTSELSINHRKNIISNGRGLMPAFGGQLSDQEAEAVAAYTLTLKK